MKKLLLALNSYFNFTKGESHAVLLLLFIMVLLLVLPQFWQTSNLSYNSDFTKLYQLADSLKKGRVPRSKQDNFKADNWKEQAQYARFNFNPNTISSEALLKLGIQKNLAERIVNFRMKVAPFLCKSDLKKVYGVNEALFNQLSDYILLPDECIASKSTEIEKYPKNSHKFSVIDLNLADTTDLMALPGIGTKLANRIIKYRDKLGGFLSLNQLKEVWGLQEEMLRLNQQNWFVTADKILKIDINKCPLKQLENHPYCGYSMAKIIIAFRQQHGAFSNFESLLKLQGLDHEKLQILKPYLLF